jgi:hypothetical protein
MSAAKEVKHTGPCTCNWRESTGAEQVLTELIAQGRLTLAEVETLLKDSERREEDEEAALAKARGES